ncbi:DNA cytosine methyltransferase [Methanocalculus taiwanensis]|uniref:DNA (cytosine-5-)-methyltransferase n=1 Tax=Methanocalculus taiwanensis TaxID=106207 RepID=A0ABD4TFK0_9EURY|nr:DNA cytosine methyltransferase [Methanocalculus taiwanensis]MCQ1537754.1 DNA cytosine methyltransferase [Methanocalculus taiwanensis]
MKPPKPDKILRVCSLFTGCGGMDLGFIGGFSHLGTYYPKTGFRIVFANDFDPDARMTYLANRSFLGDHSYDDRDVRVITDFDQIPDFDVLTAGFPCQPFSSAGNREGYSDKHGRGNLFEEVERFIQHKKPLAIVLENVRGILSSKMPDGTPVTEEISKRIAEVKTDDGELIRYKVSPPRLLKASDYGVPQQRYRVVIVAVRDGLEPFYFEKMHKYVRKESISNRRLKDVLTSVEGLPNQDEIWDFSPQQKIMVEHIIRSWKDVPYELLPDRFKRIRDQIKRYRAPNFYRRFSWDEIAGTITASAQPENCGILHPDIKQKRRFTIREVARIQSFPDKFIFKARNVQQEYKVIGNAVPPVLAYVVACTLKESLLGEDEMPICSVKYSTTSKSLSCRI